MTNKTNPALIPTLKEMIKNARLRKTGIPDDFDQLENALKKVKTASDTLRDAVSNDYLDIDLRVTDAAFDLVRLLTDD